MADGASDQAILPRAKDDIRDWRLDLVITVVDRRFSSADNLACLTRAGGHYIAEMHMRTGGDLVEAVLARQGRYQQIRGNLRVKEVKLDHAPRRRFVICHNPAQEERDRHHRDEAIKRIEAELERIRSQRERDAKRATTGNARAGRGRPHARRMRADRTPHPEAVVEDIEERTAGHRPHQDQGGGTAGRQVPADQLRPAPEYRGYRGRLQGAPGSRARILRSENGAGTTTGLPPPRTPHPRLRTAVLAPPLLIRVAERRTGQTRNRISTQLGRVHEFTLAGDAGQITQTTPLNSEQATPYPDCGIKPPPRITAADPA